jgi:hypothetical protein
MTAHQVDDATGSPDDDLNSVFQSLDLLSDWSSSDATGSCDGRLECQSLGFVGDLLAQFSRRCQDKRLSIGIIQVDEFQDGKNEGSGFAGTSASLTDAVGPRESDGNESGLNGTRCGESGSLD